MRYLYHSHLRDILILSLFVDVNCLRTPRISPSDEHRVGSFVFADAWGVGLI